MKKKLKITLNAPFTLGFALLCGIATLLCAVWKESAALLFSTHAATHGTHSLWMLASLHLRTLTSVYRSSKHTSCRTAERETKAVRYIRTGIFRYLCRTDKFALDKVKVVVSRQRCSVRLVEVQAFEIVWEHGRQFLGIALVQVIERLA